MTSRERIERMIKHMEADRVPIVDNPWAGTLSRWKREGMPSDADWRDYFDVDKVECISTDISPQYDVKVLEETDHYRIVTSEWGVTMKHFKDEDSTPEFLDFKVNTPEAWEEAKARMKPDKSRIDWKRLEKMAPIWKKNGSWVEAGFWFGFDVTHSWMVGTETVLISLIDNPEWICEIISTYLDMCIAQFEMVLDAGYKIDCISWPDDMGYKNTPFFSPSMYRELIKPFHKKAVDWAHNRGIYARLHSCGDIMTLMPDVVDTGIDILNPIEIKAGMDAEKLKAEYGDTLTLHGGTNAQLWDKADVIVPMIEALVPKLKENGGYIFASDHSIPNSVSAETFRQIVDAAKRAGKY